MDVPNLQALVALETVARLGSVTRAAAELHLTQSAVSHRLHALQRELGVQLIEREGRGVALTPEARELAKSAGDALATLTDAIARISGPRDEVLSIGCSPTFAIRFLVPRLSTFHKQHPELDLRIAASDVPVDAVHGADVAIHLSSGPTPTLYGEKLIDEVVFPVASPRLLGAGGKDHAWTLNDLLSQALLHDEALSADPKRVGWSTWLEAAGVSAKRKPSKQGGLTFSHAYLAIEAALAGDGVALARRSLVADDLARGRLIAPFALAVPSGLSYWFVSARGPTQRPSVKLLREFLSQQLTAAKRIADKYCGQRARPKRAKKPVRR